MPTSGTNPKIVFFGNERLVSGLVHTDAPILRRLISDGYEIACIVSNYSEGVSRNNRELEVANIGREHGIPVLLPKRVKDIEGELQSFQVEAAVLVAYGQIIPQSTIDIFPKGIINIHPSLLPRYRGPTPIEAAITHGDAETGVSIMQLAAKMDAGPIFAQKTITVGKNDTKFDLYTKIVQTSANLLSDVLPSIINGDIIPVPQHEADVSYCHLLNKDDSVLNPATQTAPAAERFVRAYLNYPKSKLTIHGYTVIVRKARISDSHAEGLTIPFKDDTFLTVDELIAPSGKTMSGADFQRGYKE